MKVLVIGSSGFVGKAVCDTLSSSHEVYGASQAGGKTDKNYHIDLTKINTIKAVLEHLQPEVIINCAGVVDNSEKANLNPVFTKNILDAVVKVDLTPKCIIICGSAAEYGLVGEGDIPVSEDVPLKAKSGYGLSKLKEETIALGFRKNNNLPIIIARIFNPIGEGMNPKQLLPNILGQIQEVRMGNKKTIEVSRLDSKRDYINIKDVALAIKAMVELEPKEAFYNVGSGKSTSNQELIELILKNSKIVRAPKVIESSAEPEPVVAIQADITKIKNDLGWQPLSTVEETVNELMHAN